MRRDSEPAAREDAGISADEAHLPSVGLVGMAQVTARYWLSTRDTSRVRPPSNW